MGKKQSKPPGAAGTAQHPGTCLPWRPHRIALSPLPLLPLEPGTSRQMKYNSQTTNQRQRVLITET